MILLKKAASSLLILRAELCAAGFPTFESSITRLARAAVLMDARGHETARTLRNIAAFFARDLAIARGCRGAFLLEMLETLFGVAT